jgi:hypothetical protein
MVDAGDFREKETVNASIEHSSCCFLCCHAFSFTFLFVYFNFAWPVHTAFAEYLPCVISFIVRIVIFARFPYPQRFFRNIRYFQIHVIGIFLAVTQAIVSCLDLIGGHSKAYSSNISDGWCAESGPPIWASWARYTILPSAKGVYKQDHPGIPTGDSPVLLFLSAIRHVL